MGCGSSLQVPGQYWNDELMPNIFLMGTGDSGKTTFVEQAQSPVANAVSDQAFILRNLQWNAIDSIQALLREVDRLGVAFSGEMKNQERIVKAFQTNGDPPQEYTEQLVSGICALWESLKVQQVYAQRNKFWLPENASYYITHAQRFASAPFEPTEEDRALAARRTLWVITSHIFEQQPCKFHIADMGGLRGVRRKWALCVQDPAALVYMTALTGYHRVLFEDCSVNMLADSLAFFEEVIMNPVFLNAPVYVLLNKKDVFDQLIKTYPLTECFRDYDGAPGDSARAVDFIKGKFVAIANKHMPGKVVQFIVMSAVKREESKQTMSAILSAVKKLHPAEEQMV